MENRLVLLSAIPLALLVLLTGCINTDVFFSKNHLIKEPEFPVLEITSSFPDNGLIPIRFTCDGEDISPGLNIANLPNETKSLVVILENIDAPNEYKIQWIAWNIPPGNIPEQADNLKSTVNGKNNKGKHRYSGPCPPGEETNKYYFRVYGLNSTLPLQEGSSYEKLNDVMQGHLIAKGQMMGYYTH